MRNHNAQGEYYLTDVVAHGGGRGRAGRRPPQPTADWETLGVNSKAQLAELERIASARRARSALMEHGVTLARPGALRRARRADRAAATSRST
ncbi:MAG: hypothetical protein MZW92_40625 [Comamonadaceae bacterium]|nr:hypothetical protein [Comamonadaceae bacterium]